LFLHPSILHRGVLGVFVVIIVVVVLSDGLVEKKRN